MSKFRGKKPAFKMTILPEIVDVYKMNYDMTNS